MNNDQNKGITGVAKTGTGILGNTVSGVSNTLGSVVGKLTSFLTHFPPDYTPHRLKTYHPPHSANHPTPIPGGLTRGVGETVNGVTGGVAKPLGDGVANVGTGVENGLSDVAKGARDAGNWKK